jgi:hypothetical protein
MKTPSHLPEKLTITLWDFSWYTQTAPGEPFHDLDEAFREAVARGYNTVRICAAPLLLFGEHDLDTTALQLTNMGGETGQRTRWYDAAGGQTIDGRAHLLHLFEAARRQNCYVIISSWEYQQSPAFLTTSAWHDMLRAISPEHRHIALANALSRMTDFLGEAGLADRIAYLELHNEVDLSRLGQVVANGENTYWGQRPYLEKALDTLQQKQPELLSTVCYGVPPYLDMNSIPDNAQVAHQHIYVYGVLHELERWAQVRAAAPVFPTPELKSLLRPDAPDFASWGAQVPPWRLEATGISPSMFYAYDWVDPVAWDTWLYRNYGRHELEMKQAVDARLRATANWARHHDVPAVIGEGWIGYTPLLADFEDGPIGQDFARHAVNRCAELGFWGTLPGSNSAPQHPGWANTAFQKELNASFAAS